MITSSSSSSGGTNLMWNFTLQRLSPTISTHYSAAENKTIMHKMPRKVLTVVGRGNTTISFALIIIIVIVVITVPEMCQSQQHTIVELKQGTVSGLKVFPESSRTPVYSFLGIPYAKAPVDNLRFAPPEPHPGWNNTLLARNMQPLCPQPDLNPFEDANWNYVNSVTTRTSEDCLFLNVWTPEIGFRQGNLPVLAIITGEEMAFDWLTNRPTGLDLASEAIVVVTIQYRTNIFGWLALPNSGNFGLLDQIEALRWIRTNIEHFGGDLNRVTLLGHGTTGASNAMIHLTSPLTEGLFSRAIIMSGTIFSSYSLQMTNGSEFYLGPTRRIVVNLACDASEVRFTIACLRRKSTSDLLKAFEEVYQVGNYSRLLGPVQDNRVVVDDPRKLIAVGQYKRVPLIIGVCNNEGAFLKDNWIAFAKNGPKSLKNFIDTTIIPNILEHYAFTDYGQSQIRDTIDWRFFDQVPKTVPYFMDALQKIVSESRYEVPFFETIEIMSRLSDDALNNSITVSSSQEDVQRRDGGNAITTTREQRENLFVYSFQQATPIDMRGRVNYFGGASHSSDLPYLMGPSLLQQIGRRKLTQSEDKMCKIIRQLFGDFIKTGNPTPGRLFDSWKTYTSHRKFIKVLSTRTDKIAFDDPANAVERNLVMLEYILAPETDDHQGAPPANSQSSNPYSIGRNTVPTATSTSYLNDAQHLHYYNELQKVYSFWRTFLPRIQKNAQSQMTDGVGGRNAKGDEDSLDGSSHKFKHAFFSMLTLFCLLLTVLGICLYLLKKNNKTFPKSSAGGYL